MQTLQVRPVPADSGYAELGSFAVYRNRHIVDGAVFDHESDAYVALRNLRRAADRRAGSPRHTFALA